MQEDAQKTAITRRTPAEWMAWISLLAPLFAILSPMLFYQAFADSPERLPWLWIPLALLSVTLGSISFASHKKHRRRRTVYMAAAGTVLGVLLGLLAIFLTLAPSLYTR